MDFEDFDGDGEPDSGTTGNENGGRASYIHYAEPKDEMVDATHLGYPFWQDSHDIIATEVLRPQWEQGWPTCWTLLPMRL
ncbi:MAG: hypothetical protein Ct9H90mP24_2110 [Methanobacteriota archaeon]|nr:MAG: hypothetical protein Ct9H90mP24_2110 [Euryarchaeota archaeon]